MTKAELFVKDRTRPVRHRKDKSRLLPSKRHREFVTLRLEICTFQKIQDRVSYHQDSLCLSNNWLGNQKGGMKKMMGILSMAVCLLAVVYVAYSRVDNSITAEDRVYIGKFLAEGGVKPMRKQRGYSDEEDYIKAVQRAIQRLAGKGECSPPGSTREPKDLYTRRRGESYDRSRVIEKMLRNAGLQTRHIMLFSTSGAGSRLKALLIPGVMSHSITEVLTRRGWMVVDPDDPWISVNRSGDPMTLRAVQSDVDKRLIAWDDTEVRTMPFWYKQHFAYVFGLYSRHGKFYPPYNFVPDINWPEFFFNLIPSS
jgi:hypothetical protein